MRLVLNGIRQAASVSMYWSLECTKLCPAGQRKINSHFDRLSQASPTLARDVVGHEMRRSVIGWSFDWRIWRGWCGGPSHRNWRAHTNDVFRVSASSRLSS
jgi:hypothetical protein